MAQQVGRRVTAREQVEAEVRTFLREQGLDSELPEVHLDSVRLTELVARVERATGAEIDFLEVDPEALDTLAGLVAQLTSALGPA